MNTRFAFLVVFFLCSLIFIARTWVKGNSVWGDGRYYFSYLRSAVIDHDLDFNNDLFALQGDIHLTPIGKVANKYSIGPAILWLPFYVGYHELVSILSNLSFPLVPDGLGIGYQMAVGIGSIFYAIVGLYLCFKILLHVENTSRALPIILGGLFSSSLIFYTSLDPINSHALSFFLSSAILYVLVVKQKLNAKRLILLSIAGSLLVMVRLQDGLLLLPLIYSLGLSKKMISFLLLGAIFFIPQVLVWYYLYGKIGIPYLLEGETFNLFKPHIIDVLWSQTYGLFIITPVIFMALVGLIIGIGNHWTKWGLILFMISTYVISSWHYYYQGASFGSRMFLSMMPYFFIGIFNLVRFVKIKRNILNGIIGVLILFNLCRLADFFIH